MSASMTMPEQVDGLEKLLTLASLKKEDIIATQEEARRQLQLTQAEQGRVAEAKAYIAKHASLANDLQRREDELVANRKAHEDVVKKHAEHVAVENVRLEKFAAQLSEREANATQVEKRNASESARLASVGVENDRLHQTAMAKVKETESTNATISKHLATENERLKEWESTLKAKAQRIRKEAEEF